MSYRSIGYLLATISVICGASRAPAAGADEVLDAVVGVMRCSATKDDSERLRCYDAASTALRSAGLPEAKTADPKAVVASFSPSDYKLVDPDDLHVAPRKFIGKPVELRNVKCFYADKGDYRCLAPSRSMITTVFAKDVGPPGERDTIESDCGAVKKIDSPLCRRTIRLVPVDFSEDAPNAFAKRMVIQSATIEFVPSARAKR